MKKIILFFALVLLCFTANAQDDNGSPTAKGKWMFGGDAAVSFSSTTLKSEYDGNEEEGKTTLSTFTINPSANYFVTDNLSVGLDLIVSTSKTKYDDSSFDDEFKSTSIAAIPNATYFFTSDKAAPYLGVGAGLLSSSAGDEDSGKFSGLAIEAKGGVMVFINNNVAVNFGVDFVTAKLSNKEDSDFKEKTNAVGVGAGVSIFL
jgi:outer membrane protein